MRVFPGNPAGGLLHLFCQCEGVAPAHAHGFGLADHARRILGAVDRTHADAQLREARAEKDRKYVSAFYIRGITGIVNEWVEDGCKEAVSEMASLIIKVVIGDNANKNTVTMQSQ